MSGVPGKSGSGSSGGESVNWSSEDEEEPQGLTVQEVPAGDWSLQSVTVGLDLQSSAETKCVTISSRIPTHPWVGSEVAGQTFQGRKEFSQRMGPFSQTRMIVPERLEFILSGKQHKRKQVC